MLGTGFFWGSVTLYFIWYILTQSSEAYEPMGEDRKSHNNNQYLYELEQGQHDSNISMAAMWMNIDE